MSGRAYTYDRTERHSRPWRGGYQGSGSWQSQQRKQNSIYIEPRSPSYGAGGLDYGRRETVQRSEPYGRSQGDIRTSRVRPLPPPVSYPRRTGYTVPPPVRPSNRGSFRPATTRTSAPRKSERPRKRFLSDANYRKNKRSRVTHTSRPKTSVKSRGPRSVRLMPATLILAAGEPGEAEEHKFLDVKFQTHPFIRPRVSVNQKSGMITFEIVEVTKYGGVDSRSRCEFSVLKRDIASIIAFVGDKIPADITKKKPQASIDLTSRLKAEESEITINPDTMSSGAIRRELSRRKLSTRGLKAVLIRRLKEALAKETDEKAVVLQTVDPSVLFVHVDSCDEDRDQEIQEDEDMLDAEVKHSEDEAGRENHSENESAHEKPEEEEVGDEEHEIREKEQIEEVYSEQEEEVDESAEEPVYEEQMKEGEMEEVHSEQEEDEEDEPEEEFSVEDCYAYASGFQGKVAKKALLKAFGEFGKIVGVKQVQKKCRIQYDHPSCVDHLIHCDPPFEFNGKALDISRTLDPSKRKPSKRSEDKWRRKGRADSDDEVETGRGDEKDGDAPAATKKRTRTRKATSKRKKAPAKRTSTRSSKRVAKGDAKKKASVKKVPAKKKSGTKKGSPKKGTTKKVVAKKTRPTRKKRKSTTPEKQPENIKHGEDDLNEESENFELLEHEEFNPVMPKQLEPESAEGANADDANEHKEEEDERLAEPVEEPQESEMPEEESEKIEENQSEKPQEMMNNDEETMEEPTNPVHDEQEDVEMGEPAGLEVEEPIELPEAEASPKEKVDTVNEEEKTPNTPAALEDDVVDAVRSDKEGENAAEGIHDPESAEGINDPESAIPPEDMEREDDEEESHYKDKVGFKDGVSMLDHLKRKFKKSADENLDEEVTVVGKDVVDTQKTTQGKEATGDEKDEEEFVTKSYRVVIALKRAARFLRRAESLLSRDTLSESRIIILEFALTSKSSTSKKIFTAVMEGPLKEVAHGEVWPEKGPLSFKHTITNVLSEMQVTRAKEKRLSGAEAMFEENQSLKKKCKGFEVKVKELTEEVQSLRKRIKKAKSCLS